MGQGEGLRERSEVSKPKDMVGWLVALAMFQLIKLKYSFNIDSGSVDNLMTINKLLEDKSVIIYTNHPAIKDSLIIPYLRLFLTSIKQIMVPMAEKYMIPNRRKKSSIPIWLMTKMAGKLGFVNFLPTHQKDIDVKPLFGKEQSNQGQGHVLKPLNNSLSKPGGVVGITPTGTRTGEIKGKFHRGLARLLIKHPDTPVGAVAIKHDPDGKINLHVGKPFTLDQIRGDLLEGGNEEERVTAYCEEILLELLDGLNDGGNLDSTPFPDR